MIEVQSLTHYYGDWRAVNDVSFGISANEIVGFLGLNGAGKSTTLKILGGVLIPTRGTVKIDGVDMTNAPLDIRANIGFLPEDPPLYKEMTVTDYLGYVGGLNRMTGARIKQRIPVVVQKCQLQGQEHRLIGELSHGYQKRVGIAQAIIHQPKLVILDEPISGLDPVQIVGMRDVIRGLKAESTVLVSSHILGEISQTCDRLLVLKDGAMVAKGTEAELAASSGGGTRLHLALRAELAQLESFFSGRTGVDECKLEAADDGVVDARVTLADDDREDLVVALVQAGVGVRRINERAVELEEIFLGLNREEDAA